LDERQIKRLMLIFAVFVFTSILTVI
jgi:hypothetical protein